MFIGHVEGGWVGGRTDGRTDGRMDGWIDGDKAAEAVCPIVPKLEGFL